MSPCGLRYILAVNASAQSSEQCPADYLGTQNDSCLKAKSSTMQIPYHYGNTSPCHYMNQCIDFQVSLLLGGLCFGGAVAIGAGMWELNDIYTYSEDSNLDLVRYRQGTRRKMKGWGQIATCKMM